MSELERLRGALKALEHWQASFIVRTACESIRDEIARLEAEAADPWREAREHYEEFRRRPHGHRTDKGDLLLKFYDHLTAENARLAARVAELEGEPEPAKVALLRADEIRLGDLIVTSGEIRTVDSIVKNAEKFKVQLCSGGWGSWFEPSGLVAVVNSVIPDDPILDPARVIDTAIKYLCGSKDKNTANMGLGLAIAFPHHAKPYRLKGGDCAK